MRTLRLGSSRLDMVRCSRQVRRHPGYKTFAAKGGARSNTRGHLHAFATTLPSVAHDMAHDYFWRNEAAHRYQTLGLEYLRHSPNDGLAAEQ